MRRSLLSIYLGTICFLVFLASQAVAVPLADEPLETNLAGKEVRIFGVIYPQRFNSAQGEEAHYHLLVWQGGTSVNALIETPADDLAFHDALVSLGAQPGDNLTMSSWNERHDPSHPEPKKKVTGSSLTIRLSWKDTPLGIPIEQAFQRGSEQRSASFLHSPGPSPEFRFGGNRKRLFNKIPFAPRPGCLACLYSCPSGKVSNGALSVHDYVETPSRFVANTAILPPDGTPVIVIFHLVP